MKLLKIGLLGTMIFASSIALCSEDPEQKAKVERLKVILPAISDVDVPLDTQNNTTNGYTFLMMVAQVGDVPLLQETLKKARNLEVRDNMGRTAVYHAVMGGNAECVKALLDAGAKKNTYNVEWRTPFDYAKLAHNNTMMKLLNLEEQNNAAADNKHAPAKPQHQAPTDLQLSQQLCKACVDGDLSAVKQHTATSNIAIINLPDDLGQTPLALAAMFGKIPIVQHLVSIPKIQLNPLDRQGKNPFHQAVAYGNLEVAQILYTKDKSCIENTDMYGHTPLSTSVLVNDPELTQWLLNSGANTGWCREGKDLIALGELVTRKLVLGVPNYRLKQAVRKKDFAKNKAAIHTMLLHKMGKKTAAQSTPLMSSLKKLQVEKAKHELNQKLKEKCISLTAKVQSISLQDAQGSLKQQQKNARKRAKKKRRAQEAQSSAAAQNASKTAVHSAPAPASTAKDQKTTVEFASAPIKIGSTETAAALKSTGDDEAVIDIDSDSDTERFVGEYPRSELMQKIKAGSFDFNKRIDQEFENTVMMAAAADNDVELAQLAIKKGFKNFHAQNKAGANAFTIAALCGSTEMLHLLTHYMALDTRDGEGNTALNAAVVGRRLPTLRFLLGTPLKQHINTENNYGMTPLINSVFSNDPQITKELLAHGAEPSYRPSKYPEKTALACAQNALKPPFIDSQMNAGQTIKQIFENNKAILKMLNNAHTMAYEQFLSELDTEESKQKKKNEKKLAKEAEIKTNGLVCKYYEIQDSFKQRNLLSVAELTKLADNYRDIHTKLKAVDYTGWEKKKALVKHYTIQNLLKAKQKSHTTK